MLSCMSERGRRGKGLRLEPVVVKEAQGKGAAFAAWFAFSFLNSLLQKIERSAPL